MVAIYRIADKLRPLVESPNSSESDWCYGKMSNCLRTPGAADNNSCQSQADGQQISLNMYRLSVCLECDIGSLLQITER